MIEVRIRRRLASYRRADGWFGVSPDQARETAGSVMASLAGTRSEAARVADMLAQSRRDVERRTAMNRFAWSLLGRRGGLGISAWQLVLNVLFCLARLILAEFALMR